MAFFNDLCVVTRIHTFENTADEIMKVHNQKCQGTRLTVEIQHVSSRAVHRVYISALRIMQFCRSISLYLEYLTRHWLVICHYLGWGEGGMNVVWSCCIITVQTTLSRVSLGKAASLFFLDWILKWLTCA
jgi:hypothetical protein